MLIVIGIAAIRNIVVGIVLVRNIAVLDGGSKICNRFWRPFCSEILVLGLRSRVSVRVTEIIIVFSQD